MAEEEELAGKEEAAGEGAETGTMDWALGWRVKEENERSEHRASARTALGRHDRTVLCSMGGTMQ